MPTLSITKSYADGDVLLESDLDSIRSSLLTFLNTTKIDSDNIQDDGILPTKVACDETTIDGTGATLNVKAAYRPPVGMVSPFAGTSAPTGWLLCNGATVSRTTYAALYAVVGDAFGNGNGSTTFHLPDLRGRFIRGVDGATARDPNAGTRTAMNSGGNTGDAVGSVQDDATAKNGLTNSTSSTSGTTSSAGNHQHATDSQGAHTHDVGTIGGGANATIVSVTSDLSGGTYTTTSAGAHTHTSDIAGNHTHTTSGTAAAQTISGDSETRPLNAALNFIIKY